MQLISGTLAATAALLAVCAASAQQPAAAAPAATGRQVFVDYGCAQCHGTAAQGSLSAPSLVRGMGYGRVLAKLRNKSGSMPRYSAEILSDQDVAKIADFLTALPPPPAAASIPILAD